MKPLLLIVAFNFSLLFSFQLNAQQLTIGGIEGQTVFVGTSNEIEYVHPNYSIVKMTLVNNNCLFRIDNSCYCSRTGNTKLLIRDTLNNAIDSFTLTVKRFEVFGVFLKLKDGSLIKPSQSISKQQIRQFKSLYLAHNVPWINLNFQQFDFTIVQNDDAFSFTVFKDKIPSELKFLLSQIEKGAKIYIDNIKIRMPRDDGNQVVATFDLDVN